MYILSKGIFIRHTLLTGDDWLLLQLRHTTGYCRDNAYCTSLTHCSVRYMRYCSHIFEKIVQVLSFPRNSHNLYLITKYFRGAHYLRNYYYTFLQFPELGCCDMHRTEVLSWRAVMG